MEVLDLVDGGVYLNSGYGGAGGGGWYGGAGTVPDSSADDDRGGGGGSGFVWTSSTASNVPSGYSVSSSYYLTDAATYSGNTAFTSTTGGSETGHTGNGYAKITLISGTKQVETQVTKTATRWVDIEKQIENGTLTGNFDYNGNKITETDSGGNTVEHKYINYVSYIESTGTQYIDTGFYPTSTTTVRLKFNMTKATGHVIFGYYNSEANSFRLFNYNNNAYLDYGSGSGYNRIYGGTLSEGVTYNIEFGNRYVKNLDTGENIISNTEVTFSTKTQKAGIFGDSTTNIALGKLYYCQIFDNGVLVRDFAPALDETNVPCLYDKISNQYFYNRGTGSFSYQ